MKWQDAVAMSEDKCAWRDDDSENFVTPFHWVVEDDGTGQMYDDGYMTHIELTAGDRDRWEDWEPGEPKDVIEALAELVSDE